MKNKINFIFQIVIIIGVYFTFLYYKNEIIKSKILNSYLILYFLNILLLVLCILRFIYYYYLFELINKKLLTVKLLIYELFSTYIISYSNQDNNIDSQELIIQTNYNYNINNSTENETNEFKELLLFYISYFISLISDDVIKNRIIETRIFENFIYNKLLNRNYLYDSINNPHYIFKLNYIEYYLKFNLNKQYQEGNILPLDYKKSIILLEKINKEFHNIIYYYDKINIKFYSVNIIINIFNNNLVFLILIYINLLTIILYYIQSRTHYIESIIYIIIISFIYLYINEYINKLKKIEKYSDTNLKNYLLDIYDDINLLFVSAENKIQIVFK